VNPLTRVATDHMRWIAEDPRPVIKINPHEAGSRSPAAAHRHRQHLLAHRPVPDAGACLCAELDAGREYLRPEFSSGHRYRCWIYTYAWNPERPLTQAERDGYDRGNGVMSEVDENYIPLRNGPTII
jgi:hypothetical protein